MSGIYQIYNPINNKRYVGSSINIERRFKEHISALKANRHHNQHLQNAWNKYGDQLKFEVLEYCEPEYLIETEQYYIDYYNSADRKYGYNIDKYVSHFGHHLSDETRKKLSEKAKGRKLSKEAIEKMRLAMTGKKKPKQSQTMKKKYSEGYTIPRIHDFPEEKQIEWKRHLSEGTRKRYSNWENRPEGYYLKAIFDDGSISYYPSLREASRHNNIDKGAITYAFKFKNGYIKKISCTFYKISKDEFLNMNNYEKDSKAS